MSPPPPPPPFSFSCCDVVRWLTPISLQSSRFCLSYPVCFCLMVSKLPSLQQTMASSISSSSSSCMVLLFFLYFGPSVHSPTPFPVKNSHLFSGNSWVTTTVASSAISILYPVNATFTIGLLTSPLAHGDRGHVTCPRATSAQEVTQPASLCQPLTA